MRATTQKHKRLNNMETHINTQKDTEFTQSNLYDNCKTEAVHKIIMLKTMNVWQREK